MKKEILRKCDRNSHNFAVKDVLNRVRDKWLMLTVNLKALDTDGLVTRKVYAQIPPKVEYALTKLEKGLVPPLMHLYDWLNLHMPQIKALRESYNKVKTA